MELLEIVIDWQTDIEENQSELIFDINMRYQSLRFRAIALIALFYLRFGKATKIIFGKKEIPGSHAEAVESDIIIGALY